MKKIIIAGLLCMGSAVCAAQTLTVCTSTSYTIPSAEDVSGATYEWWENGVKVSGTGAAYTNTAGKPAAGTYVYTRRAYTAACGWQNSNAFFVYVTGPVTTPVIGTPADGCVGADYVFTVPVVSGATYEWTGGGTVNGNSYTYSNATAGAMTVTVRATANVGDMVCQSAVAGATVTAYAEPVFTTQPAGTAVCSGDLATLSAAASNATAYQWYKNNAATMAGYGYTSQTYTTDMLTDVATYTVVATNGGACSTTSNDAVVSTIGTEPYTTVNFTAFSPCPDAAPGMEWYLADTRESSNPQTYTVRKLIDDRIWMVTDMKFGNLCNKTTFSGSQHSDQTGNISNETGYAGYYGDCRTGARSSHGYLYDWAAVIQQPNAFANAGGNVGCQSNGKYGPTPGDCMGICPRGWHVQTMDELDALSLASSAEYGDAVEAFVDTDIWAAVDHEYCGEFGDLSSYEESTYWTSTGAPSDAATVTVDRMFRMLVFQLQVRSFGFPVRCILDY